MVTALGCFGGDFNIDKVLFLSFSYKVSDLLSDKFLGLCMQARKTRPRSSCEGGSDPTATVTHRAAKDGVAPAFHIVPALAQCDCFWDLYRINLSSFTRSSRVK